MSALMTSTEIDFEGMKPQSSYSALTLHRKCPQAWLYRYGMRLEEDRETASPYLVIGRWWSVLSAAESLERGRAAESLRFIPRDMRDKAEGYDFDPLSVTVSDVLKAAEERWKRIGADDREEFIATLGEPLPDRLRGMYANWDAANPQRFDRERPLGVEVFWKRELPRPEGDLAWNLLADPEAVPKMSLIGFIDELYYDRERDMVVIQDGKANKDVNNVNTSLDDLMDSQLMLYVWGIAPKLKREGIEAPRAISYDRVKSVAPKEPQLTASGGLSKAVTLYDAATYRRWAMEDTRPSPETVQEIIDAAEADETPYTPEQIELMQNLEPGRFWGKPGDFMKSGPRKGQPKFGIYQIDAKVLENLETPSEQAKWARRTVDPVNRRMIEAHLRAAVDTAQDIFMTQKRAEATGQAPRNLDRRGCQFCDFADLCRAQIVGGPGGDYDLESFGLRKKPSKRTETT